MESPHWGEYSDLNYTEFDVDVIFVWIFGKGMWGAFQIRKVNGLPPGSPSILNGFCLRKLRWTCIINLSSTLYWSLVRFPL